MITKFLTGLDSKSRWDIFWVGAIQIANYVFPFITTTYLIRTIGIDLFGKTEFATILILYFVTITNYEFHISGTRIISRLRDQQKKVLELTNTILSAKVFLFFISTLLFVAMMLIWNKQFGNWLFVSTYIIVFGHLLYQPFLFQGLGKLRTLAILNLFIKAISMALIFLFVKSPDDYEYVNLNYSLGYVFIGLISLVIVQKFLPLKIYLVSLRTIWLCLKDGAYIFFTNGLIAQLTLNLSALLLGFFLPPAVIGSYSASLKIIIALHVMAFLPLKQVFYPLLSHAWINDKADYFKKFRSYTFLLFTGNLLLGVVLLSAAPYIIKLVYGEYYGEIIHILRMLSFLPFLVSLSNAFINDGLIVMGKDRLVFIVQLTLAVVNILLLSILVPLFGLTATLIVRNSVDLLTLIIGMSLYYNHLRRLT